MAEMNQNLGVPGNYRPSVEEVDELLRRAASHPLGSDFLTNGGLDSVAATFGVHAFVVDAARDALARTARACDPVVAARGR